MAFENSMSVYRQNTGNLNFGNSPSNNPSLAYQPGATLPQVSPFNVPKAPSNIGFHPDNVNSAQSFIQQQSDIRQSNQHPVAAATTQKDTEKVKSDLASIASGEKTPEQVTKSKFYMGKPEYKSLMAIGLSLMSGDSASQTYANAEQARAQGEAEETQENASSDIQNQAQALLSQGYSMPSIQKAIASGDWSQLQYKQLSPQEQAAAEQAKTADNRQYEQQIYERNRRDELADRAASAAGQTGTWSAPNKEGYSINSKTGEYKRVVPEDQVNADLPNNGQPMTTEDTNNYILKTGKDPRTGEPVKAPQLKQAQEWDKGNQGYQSLMDGTKDTLDTIDYMLDARHKDDFNSAFGGIDSRLPSTRSGTAKMDSALKTITSQSFLNSIKEMKGMGSLSDAEGKKITDAIANLDPSLPQETLRTQIKQIRDTIEGARNRAQINAQKKGYTYQGVLSSDNTQSGSSVDKVAGKYGF